MKHHVHATLHHARRVAHHIHKHHVTPRKFLVLATLLNILFLLIIGTRIFSFPNTMVGSLDVGLKTRPQVRSALIRAYAQPVTISIDTQQYVLPYEHIGVYMNLDATTSEIFAPNALPFLQALPQYIRQIVQPKTVKTPLSFSQEFYEFIDKINESQKKSEDIVYVDQNDKKATLFATRQKYVINTPLLQQELARHFGQNTALIVPLSEAPNDLEEKITLANTKLAAVYTSPLTVIVPINNINQFITLSSSDLKRYTTAGLSAASGTVEFAINTDVFLPDLTTALSVYGTNFNPESALERIGNGIRNALVTRYEGGPAESVKVGIDSGPNTEGDVASKYIEVDITQQKLFTFNKGKLLKSYRVSTGKDYPTPTGTFKILNKTGLGFSSIYNVWMPWWMGFEFSKKLHAYFGIHELPYFYTGNQKIQRPREFIGAPNTGGCVALDIGDAKEVYQFAEIGTMVVIYQ